MRRIRRVLAHAPSTATSASTSTQQRRVMHSSVTGAHRSRRSSRRRIGSDRSASFVCIGTQRMASFFFSSRRRHTRCSRDWSSDVCSSDLSSRGSIDGILASRNTALNVRFETGAIETYQDFINALRGAEPRSSEAAKPISGSARWDGKIVGASGGSVFQGHLRGERVRYDGVFLDYLDGDLAYSPLEFTLVRGHARRGEMETDMETNLSLTNWRFLPENNWTAEVNFEKVPVESIEQLLGLTYPVNGSLTGQFHGRGTRKEPRFTGLFDLADGNMYGLSFNRLRGQLDVSPDEARIADAELRFFPPGKENGRGAGIITGSAGYRYQEQTISADLVGAALPLENFEKLQSTRLPVGGQVSFRLRANGPVKTPLGEGTFRVVDLRIGQVIVGSFDGKLTSDGLTAHLGFSSAMTTGEVSGGYTL